MRFFLRESAALTFHGTQISSPCSAFLCSHICCCSRPGHTRPVVCPGRAARILMKGVCWQLATDNWQPFFMVYLTRKAEFSASHYYHNPAFTPEENRRIFGKCNNPHGHGHNYTLEVTVKGEIDPRSGFVVDLKELKEIMNREVIEVVDHRYLNKEVAEFRDLIPTTENLAVTIWKWLNPRLNVARLHRIRVYETPDLFADYYGEP